MAIVEEGPNLGGSVPYDMEHDIFLLKGLSTLLATDDTASTSALVQKSGDTSKSVAMRDKVAGKVGPMIGKWDPEAASRMIQEF